MTSETYRQQGADWAEEEAHEIDQEALESRGYFIPGSVVWNIPDHVMVIAADWAPDAYPSAGWVRVRSESSSSTWVAPLGSEIPSETFALYLGRMTMGQARALADLATPEPGVNPRSIPERERLELMAQSSVLQAFTDRMVSPDARPGAACQAIWRGLHAVATLIGTLHSSARTSLHIELGVDGATCPICLADDTGRRRSRLYPGRLDQVDAVLATDECRAMDRRTLLDVLIEVDRAVTDTPELEPPEAIYALATVVTARLIEPKPQPTSLADVARVVRALRKVREL